LSQTAGASSRDSVSWQGYLPAGSVIRLHDQGFSPDNGNYMNMTMVKLANVP